MVIINYLGTILKKIEYIENHRLISNDIFMPTMYKYLS